MGGRKMRERKKKKENNLPFYVYGCQKEEDTMKTKIQQYRHILPAFTGAHASFFNMLYSLTN